MTTTSAPTSLLATRIASAEPGDEPIDTALETSQKVLRRVTDGIYREPWSALRELISNAYDADATEVLIDTDLPRFESISIRDNGHGFTAEALASMIESIGGSTKRTRHGADIGVTSKSDPARSPGGRRLIGKMGIGLFAVSQLTHEFQVITKVTGQRTKTIADVNLFQHSEDSHDSDDATDRFRTGTVRIWKQPSRNFESQGTEILLRNLLPSTSAALASDDLWTAIHGAPDDNEWRRPRFHIGFVGKDRQNSYIESPLTPWKNTDSPDAKFSKLVDAMFSRANETTTKRPSLQNTFDNYLQFVWKLSLAAPLDYVDKHPFDLDATAEPIVFQLSNSKSSGATPLLLDNGHTIRKSLSLRTPERGGESKFKVVMDGLALRRPLRFDSKALDARPLLFVGRDRPDLRKIPESIRGGDLEFEAYLMWSHKIVPLEHTGILLRINDASGTMFDSTFLHYPISEQKRLAQVTAEIFVTEGLDAALNIDRESFNTSHPHYQYITTWAHNAFKQFATRHKSLSKTKRTATRAEGIQSTKQRVSRIAEDAVEAWSDGAEVPVRVEFVDVDPRQVSLQVETDRLSFSRKKLFDSYPVQERPSATFIATREIDEEVMRSIAQILYSSGALSHLTQTQQEQLIADLGRVIFQMRQQ